MTALIEKVPRDLPIYARSVLTIIETVLKSNDISMVEDCIETFETFCRHQDIAIIAADQGIAQKYREVVHTYAGFADPNSPSYSPAKTSPPVAIRWRNAGLRAIKSVVSSESLAADGGTSLKIILPVILANLYSPNEDVLIPLKAKLRDTENTDNEGVRSHRISVATVHTVDSAGGDPTLAAQSTADNDRQAEMDARFLALRCLEKIIVSGSNRGQIRIAASTVLRFIAKQKYDHNLGDASNGNTQNGNWATSLIELVANWCPVQVRFVILITAMDILLETTPKEDALDSAYTILSVVDWLLKSSVNMIGLSVMDVLLGLMNYASNILSPRNIDTEKKKPEDILPIFTSISSPRKTLLSLLEHSIGDLATHIYYGDQVPDMIRAILRRHKPATNHESNAQSVLATVHEAEGEPVEPSQSPSTIEVPGEQTFLTATAKLTSLRAVKAILEVANKSSKPPATASEVRNPVGIYVWEGTQGLLRDSDRGVRFAYADAFLSWLSLETNKDDLKARVDTPKLVRPSSKRDSEQSEKPTRRTSAPGNQREKVALAAQTTFLHLLHLAIYDSALESASSAPEILLLHLVLTTMVENLGVNAIQYGLPMILKLQDDIFIDFGSATARINVGSLVHGYLLAVSEKFNLETSMAGIEIQSEINRRRKDGHWLSSVRLPPAKVSEIILDNEKQPHSDVGSPNLKPFQNLAGLVDGIDESYRQYSSPPQSPPTSPAARGFNFPVLNGPPPQISTENGLPSSVREQLFAPWSREACLAFVEQESTKTLSLSGSRGGTLARNSNANGVNGSQVGSGAKDHHHLSAAEGSHTPETSSGRNSPVRATTLRRVLSVNVEAKDRRRSPLRDHVETSNASVVSSDSESMISGSSSNFDADGNVLALPEDEASGDIPRRPSASAIVLSGDRNGDDNTLSGVDSEDDIPPVPPIPTILSIPGGFPNDSQRELMIPERPSTAPDNTHSSGIRSKPSSSHARNANSLSRNKSRSSNNLASAEPFQGLDFKGENQRDQLVSLLNGVPTSNGILTNGSRLHTASSKEALPRSFSTRRHLNGGIGRPPY